MAAVGFLILYSPLLGLAAAVLYFLHYRAAPEPKRRLFALDYAFFIAFAGFIGFVGGLFGGVFLACSVFRGGNLCGLVGFLAGGPLSATAAMVLTAWHLTRRALRTPDTRDDAA